MKGGTRRRMAIGILLGAFIMGVVVRMGEAGLVSWFPGARALGGSSTRRLGGLTGLQLTGTVAEAPDLHLRRGE